MFIQDLKLNNFLEIFEYLSLKEIVKLRLVSTFFRDIISKNDQVFHRRFSKEIGEENPDSLKNWKIILSSLRESESSHFVPFYTDGGTYASTNSWFIQRLIQDDCTHCTVKDSNILIKFIYHLSPNMQCFSTINEYKQDERTYYIKDIEETSELYPQYCQTIHSIKFRIPYFGYTCPAKVLMFFGSLHKAKDIDLIKKFYDCKDSDSVEKVANDNELKYEISESQRLKEIKFKKNRNGVFPIAWVEINEQTRSNDFYQITINDFTYARYFYLLLLDSFKLSHDRNIDMGEIYPLGYLRELWIN